MATTRIMPLHIGKGRTESCAISAIIDYVANPQKTDHGRLITSYECDSRVADAEFMLAKRQYIAATGRVRGADDVKSPTMFASPSVLGRSPQRKPTGWAWNLPSGSPRANTPLSSVPTLIRPMSIIISFGVRSTWTVTGSSATFGAAQKPSVD